MKWKNFSWKFRYGLIGFILGSIALAFSSPNVLGYLKEPIELKEIKDVKKLQDGDHVKLDISIVSDCIISETTTIIKNGNVQTPNDKSRYYVIPFWDEFGKYYLTVKIKHDDFDAIKQAIEVSDAWFRDPNSSMENKPNKVFLSIDGLIKDMNNDEKAYTTHYKGYMNELYVVYSTKTPSFVICILGLILFVSGIVLLFICFMKWKHHIREFIDKI